MKLFDKIASFFHQRKLNNNVPVEKCDPDVYNNGRVIAVFGDMHRDVLTAWCKVVAQESGQKVDWCFSCGRYVVKAVGDLEKVDDAAYWYWMKDGTVKHMGEAKSWYGYHPGGHNHWLKEE